MARNSNIDDDTRERAMRFVRDREGQNPNIDDDTRARARKFVESGGKKESPPKPAKKAAPKPRPKAKATPTDTGDETDRLARRAPAPRPAIAERSDTPDASMPTRRPAPPTPVRAEPPSQGANSVPRPFTDRERAARAGQPTRRGFGAELADNAGKALDAAGPLAASRGTIASGLGRLFRSARDAMTRRQADDIMAAGNKRATNVRANKEYDDGVERAAAQERTNRVMREYDGAMEYAKGGKVAKYAKGGSVGGRGDGLAKRGKTKGRMV